jgi:transcriptional regulator
MQIDENQLAMRSFSQRPAMYSPKQFRTEDTAIIHYLIQRYNFATLLSNKGDEQHISHLPFLFDAKAGVLQGHMARANPQWRSFDSGRSLTVIFQGPHSYVSPRWYLPAPGNVPTWNYAALHLRGIPHIIKDEDRAFGLLRKLANHHDPEFELPSETRAMLPEIVAFEIEVLEVETKLKLSQNRCAEDFLSVIRELLKSEDQTERETGALMQILLDRQSDDS